MTKIYKACRCGLAAVILFCLLGCSTAWAKAAKAEPEPAVPQAPEMPPKGVYIADYANVVREEDREAMAALGRELQHKYGVWLICLTEDALDDAPLGLYADTVRTAWGMSENDGLLLFIRRGRRLHCANGKELAAKLTREQMDQAVAPAAEEMRQGKISAALTRIYKNIATMIVAVYPPSTDVTSENGTAAPEAGTDVAGVETEDSEEE